MFRALGKTELKAGMRQIIRNYNIKAVENGGKLSTLTVKVHGGSRYSDKDGLSHLVSRFNFQNTGSKSSLRLVRESELLGGQLESSIDREFITLKATFLKENLPYYVEALGNVLYKTSFKHHELTESVLPAALYDLTVAQSNPIHRAKDLLYNVTYRNGLGNPVLYDGVEEITLDDIKAYADKVYRRDNIDIIGEDVNENDLKRFINDSYFNTLPSGQPLTVSSAPKSYIGESRLRSSGQSVAAIGVALVKGDIPQYEVLSNYLNSALYDYEVVSHVDNYNDSHGFFNLYVKGSNPEGVTEEIKKIVSDLKNGVDLTPAKQLTELNEGANALNGLKAESLKNFKLGKFSYAAVGDVSKLPYLEDL